MTSLGRERKPSLPAAHGGASDHRSNPATGGASAVGVFVNWPPRGDFRQFSASHLVGQRVETAPGQDLQTIERSAVRGEILGRYRAISRSPGPRRWCFAVMKRASVRHWSAPNSELPLAPKRPRTMTHDYVRHGTITLFAALNQLTGKLIARTEARRHPCRVVALPQADRSRNTARPRPASDRG